MLKDYILIKVKPVKGREDVVGCKLLQTFDFIKNKLEKEGFGVVDCGWDWRKEADALFWFKSKLDELNSTILPLLVCFTHRFM